MPADDDYGRRQISLPQYPSQCQSPTRPVHCPAGCNATEKQQEPIASHRYPSDKNASDASASDRERYVASERFLQDRGASERYGVDRFGSERSNSDRLPSGERYQGVSERFPLGERPQTSISNDRLLLKEPLQTSGHCQNENKAVYQSERYNYDRSTNTRFPERYTPVQNIGSLDRYHSHATLDMYSRTSTPTDRYHTLSTDKQRERSEYTEERYGVANERHSNSDSKPDLSKQQVRERERSTSSDRSNKDREYHNRYEQYVNERLGPDRFPAIPCPERFATQERIERPEKIPFSQVSYLEPPSPAPASDRFFPPPPLSPENTPSPDCFSNNTFPSPTAAAPPPERFIPPPPLSPSPTETYAPKNAERFDKIQRYQGYSSSPNIAGERIHNNEHRYKDRYNQNYSDRYQQNNQQNYNSDKYVNSDSRFNGDRYIPPNAHMPVERYVPQPQEPYFSTYQTYGYKQFNASDPYMRRDLAFHYRLPLPYGNNYQRIRFAATPGRFKCCAYQEGYQMCKSSPGSSSSSSVTSQGNPKEVSCVNSSLQEIQCQNFHGKEYFQQEKGIQCGNAQCEGRVKGVKGQCRHSICVSPSVEYVGASGGRHVCATPPPRGSAPSGETAVCNENCYPRRSQSTLTVTVWKLTTEEAQHEPPLTWYLSHFGVVNPNKPGKVRTVFDAAAKSHGVSLNSCLLPGPDLLAPLISVLMTFRIGQIAVTSDIREMFCQVQIRPEDRHAQRFLWRGGDYKKEPDVYEMIVMTFGATCSPSCAQYVKNMNAELHGSPRAVEAINNRHYVDDYLDSFFTPTEAYKIIIEVQKVQKKAGYELTGWSTNSPNLKTMLSLDENIQKDLNLTESSVQRVLGLIWDAVNDNFIFKLDKKILEESISKRPTKRQVLRVVMSIYDPLGFIANFVIKGRLIVQDIWRSGIDWDTHINDEIYQNWLTWMNDLNDIKELKIPRCLSVNIPNSSSIELHIFCDSSKQAYSTVIYVRTLTDKNIDVALLTAKARVTPNKPISIPRLELQAALIGSRLLQTVKTSLKLNVKKEYFYTDSTTVLYWICGDGKKLGQYEGHRVGEIQELTEISDWNWVPSKFNPADLATRSYDGNNQVSFKEWFSGPEFLKIRDKSVWPIKDISQVKKQKQNEIHITLTTTTSSIISNHCLPKIDEFSAYDKLIRATAWIFRCCEVFKSKLKSDKSCSKKVTLEDMKKAETEWVRRCQEESFAEEITILRKHETGQNKDVNISKQSRLKSLHPSLSENGLIVLSGRTDLAPYMTFAAKRPAILPKDHLYTKLYLMKLHENFGHQGIENVLNKSRQKFWIIDGRSAVKKIFRNCLKCKLDKPTPLIPLMGQIPKERLTPTTRPFIHTGIDFFGPFQVSVGRRSEKRWGVIFTCLNVRAVHLEVAHSLNTDSAIMALRRMISRRGQPELILSDNGTNLRGACEEIRKAMKEIDFSKIENEMMKKEIKWKFIPPASPNMGGAWERLIRCVKKSFYAILRNQKLKDELLLTIFSEVENMLNSRPLTKVSVDPNDYEPLTPNDFLLGAKNNISPLGEEKDLNKQYRRCQEVLKGFWKRWIKEYLPTLTKRNKWTHDNTPLQINDIVIICDENITRNDWRLGKIETIFYGPDGRARVAEVKTKSGLLKRPISKLAKITS